MTAAHRGPGAESPGRNVIWLSSLECRALDETIRCARP